MRRREIAVLGAILVAATALRLHRLGDELWLDEILTALRVVRLDAATILSTYESQNQHLLYSLLARGAVVLLGDTPAALRLPAVGFGVLSIGATWLLGRTLLSSRQGLLAAALLAVSEQHVWFSQDARGYTALLFFTLLSSWLLLRALADGRTRRWIAYAVAAALGVTAHLTMLFVIGAHLVLALRPLPGSRAVPWRRRVSGAALGFATAAALTLLCYAPMLPQILAVTAVEGRSGTVPEWSSSGWAAREVASRLTESFVEPLVAACAVAAGFAGAWSVRRRSPELLELFALPIAIGLVVVVGSGHHVWPRLFFFAIGFAALLVVAGADALGAAAGRALARTRFRLRDPGAALAVLLIAAAATGLPRAYGPKQRHAAALALVDAERAPGDVTATVGPSTVVVRAYLGRDWLHVASADELARARRGARRVWLVHSFPVQLRARHADIARMLDRDFVLIARFAGTLRGGDVLVWRADPPEDGFAAGPG